MTVTELALALAAILAAASGSNAACFVNHPFRGGRPCGELGHHERELG